MTEPPRLRRITAEEHGEGWTIYLASSKNAVWMRHTRDEKPNSKNHIEAEYMNTETLLRDSDLTDFFYLFFLVPVFLKLSM